MIAKEVEKRKGTSSYTRLVTYLTDPQTERGKVNRVVRVRATHLENDLVSDDLGLSCAMAEVEHLQALNKRATEKTLHLMLSFHEELDLKTLYAIECEVVERLGYGAHQRISVVHGDEGNPHLHIAINKVYAETRRRKDGSEYTVYLNRHLGNGWDRLGVIAQQIEREFGLIPDNHGVRVLHASKQEALQGRLQGTWAKEMRAAGQWEQAVSLSAEHGVTLRPTGNTGLRLVADDGTTIAASRIGKDLGRAALEQRWGPLPGAGQAPLRRLCEAHVAQASEQPAKDAAQSRDLRLERPPRHHWPRLARIRPSRLARLRARAVQLRRRFPGFALAAKHQLGTRRLRSTHPSRPDPHLPRRRLGGRGAPSRRLQAPSQGLPARHIRALRPLVRPTRRRALHLPLHGRDPLQDPRQGRAAHGADPPQRRHSGQHQEPAQAAASPAFAKRIKRTAGRALREACSWQARHEIAAAHGLRFLPRGGGLVVEDVATGETTTASSVNNQLSLGRAEKRLGPYQPPTIPLPPSLQEREAVVECATAQAKQNHVKRRKAILALEAGPERDPWLDASLRAFARDRQRIAALHVLGTGQAPTNTASAPRSTPSVFRAYAQAQRSRRRERGIENPSEPSHELGRHPPFTARPNDPRAESTDRSTHLSPTSATQADVHTQTVEPRLTRSQEPDLER